jgi:hypothetical protein
MGVMKNLAIEQVEERGREQEYGDRPEPKEPQIWSSICLQCAESFESENPGAPCCEDCYDIHVRECDHEQCSVIQGGRP